MCGRQKKVLFWRQNQLLYVSIIVHRLSFIKRKIDLQLKKPTRLTRVSSCYNLKEINSMIFAQHLEILFVFCTSPTDWSGFKFICTLWWDTSDFINTTLDTLIQYDFPLYFWLQSCHLVFSFVCCISESRVI